MGSKSFLVGVGLAALLMSTGGCGSTQPTASQTTGSSSSGSSSGQGGYQNYGGGQAGTGGSSGRSGGNRRAGFGFNQAALSKVLGLSQSALATEMKTKTLAEIAKAQNVSQATLGAALVANMKSRWDQMVTAGGMDQATENARLAQFQKNLPTLLNAPPGQGFPMGRGFRRGGGAGGTYGGSYSGSSGGSPGAAQ